MLLIIIVNLGLATIKTLVTLCQYEHVKMAWFCHCSVRSVMHKHLEKMGEVTFDKIFNQKLGECKGPKNMSTEFDSCHIHDIKCHT